MAFLHVAQPLVRTWARGFSGRDGAVSDAHPQPVAWTGDRLVWVRCLHRKLAENRLQAGYGGPHDPWDLQLRAGPFLRGHLTTAVAWNWVPHCRLSVRPSYGLLVSLAAGALLSLFGLPIGYLVLAGIAAWELIEAVRLWRATMDAVRETSGAGACAGHGGE